MTYSPGQPVQHIALNTRGVIVRRGGRGPCGQQWVVNIPGEGERAFYWFEIDAWRGEPEPRLVRAPLRLVETPCDVEPESAA